MRDTGTHTIMRRRRLGWLALGATAWLVGCGGGSDDDCDDDNDQRKCRGGGSIQTLYDAFVALRSGMTRAQVIALVPVRPSQGADTYQVLWVDGNEALGVRFNGSSDGSTIVFAQWGLDIPSGGRQETRSF